jgi:hypothetical protein
MNGKPDKIIFFSAIFVVFVAVAVVVATHAETKTGYTSPAQLWEAIEHGKIANQTFVTISGIIHDVDDTGMGYSIVCFAGCSNPFVWYVPNTHADDYLNKQVAVNGYVVYAGELADTLGMGVDGWVVMLTSM